MSTGQIYDTWTQNITYIRPIWNKYNLAEPVWPYGIVSEWQSNRFFVPSSIFLLSSVAKLICVYKHQNQLICPFKLLYAYFEQFIIEIRFGQIFTLSTKILSLPLVSTRRRHFSPQHDKEERNKHYSFTKRIVIKDGEREIDQKIIEVLIKKKKNHLS